MTAQLYSNNDRQIHDFTNGITAVIEKLQRLAQAMDDHLGISPDDVAWVDVGTINKINADLQEVVDFTFQEGECAR